MSVAWTTLAMQGVRCKCHQVATLLTQGSQQAKQIEHSDAEQQYLTLVDIGLSGIPYTGSPVNPC